MSLMLPDAISQGGGRPEKFSGLESLRGFAAIYVFMHHAHLFIRSPGKQLFSFGQEAVILFFLLSGFVIYYSATKRRVSIGEYFFHRVRRIYPVLIVVLAISYVGASLRSGNFLPLNLSSLLSNLAMLQDIPSLKRGVMFETYYGNSPLWSLSYEWWFYIAFIPIFMCRTFAGNFQIWVVAAVSLAGYLWYQLQPNQIALFSGYFIIWWMGVELAREWGRNQCVTFRGQQKSLLILSLFVSLWSLPVLVAMVHGNALLLGVDPVLQFRHFAAALLILVLALSWSKFQFFGFGKLFGWFTILAPVSFFLYAAHYPILAVTNNYFGGNSLKSATVAFAVTIALGWLVEVKLMRRLNSHLIWDAAKNRIVFMGSLRKLN